MPTLDLSAFTPATQHGFLRAPAGWLSDWHPAPQRQVIFYLVGEIETGVSDGEVRRFGVRSVTLMEDTTGKGHRSHVVGTTEVLSAIEQLEN